MSAIRCRDPFGSKLMWQRKCLTVDRKSECLGIANMQTCQASHVFMNPNWRSRSCSIDSSCPLLRKNFFLRTGHVHVSHFQRHRARESYSPSAASGKSCRSYSWVQPGLGRSWYTVIHNVVQPSHPNVSRRRTSSSKFTNEK